MRKSQPNKFHLWQKIVLKTKNFSEISKTYNKNCYAAQKSQLSEAKGFADGTHYRLQVYMLSENHRLARQEKCPLQKQSRQSRIKKLWENM